MSLQQQQVGRRHQLGGALAADGQDEGVGPAVDHERRAPASVRSPSARDPEATMAPSWRAAPSG